MSHAPDQHLARTAGTAPALSPGNGTAVTGRRRRISARSRLGFWFDAVLLAAYTLAYSIGFTRLAIHEWLGIALGLALPVHFTAHGAG